MIGSIFSLAFFIVIIGAILLVLWTGLVTILICVGGIGYVETHETIYLVPLLAGVSIAFMTR